ncbi:MAG TPA: hypothetical protein VJR89_28705 [Polyangiales bacterium]|nr:hypothetical protein [Polyangiales bacterium]
MDGSVAGTEGSAGQSGGGGAAAESGAGASGTGGASASGGSGSGGMSVATAGMSAPPLLENGASCADDARCKSGHCDGVCCDKGVQCCKDVSDCKTDPAGLGMSCDDRANCRGSAGKIVCTDFKCVTLNGQRNDMACLNTLEANDCGLYPSVFCRGGEMQTAPQCATSCTKDTECDPEAHCDEGKCVPDLANGEPCKRAEDCAQRNCKSITNGVGICCSALADCCKEATDCPAFYRMAPVCTDANMCAGDEIVAQCNGNICGSQHIKNDAACNGKAGPNCGLYKDVVCQAGRNNTCKLSCANMGDCDANAFCNAGKCEAKRENGKECANGNQCTSGNCGNGVCCGAGMECCTRVEQCTQRLDLKCDGMGPCQGTRRSVTCEGSACVYGPNTQRIADDRACTTGGDACGAFKDIQCTGAADQDGCLTQCASDSDCDRGLTCARDVSSGTLKCAAPTTGGAGMGGSPGNGNGNGQGS